MDVRHGSSPNLTYAPLNHFKPRLENAFWESQSITVHSLHWPLNATRAYALAEINLEIIGNRVEISGNQLKGNQKSEASLTAHAQDHEKLWK